ncbi:hypothetical protein [Nonomuraea sp. NPDC050691]
MSTPQYQPQRPVTAPGRSIPAAVVAGHGAPAVATLAPVPLTTVSGG